jgi:hypothetical protein
MDHNKSNLLGEIKARLKLIREFLNPKEIKMTTTEVPNKKKLFIINNLVDFFI